MTHADEPTDADDPPDADDPTDAADIEPGRYANPTDAEIVEWLPDSPSDRRVRYGDGPQRFGDLRLPPGGDGEDHPVIAFVHGGIWRSRWSIDHTRPFVEALAAAGFATWNVEYRRLGNDGGGWPGTFRDVAAAVDHLRELATTEPLDLDRVVLVGHSAGGHLAHWAAARHRVPEGSPLATADPLPVAGAVALAGILDLDAHRRTGPDGALELLGVETPAAAADRYPHASPRHLLPLGVPQAVVVGSADADHRIAIAESYADAARAAGDDVSDTLLEGANHFDLVDPDGPALAVVEERVRALLDRPASRDEPG